MSNMKYIQVEPQEDIATIRINRPEALNAMNTDVISELSRAIDIVGVDDSIKVVIITGAGDRSFCAGADISYMVRVKRHSTTKPPLLHEFIFFESSQRNVLSHKRRK